MIIIITILAYFCVLLLFSHITARRTSSNETFYRANRRFAMVYGGFRNGGCLYFGHHLRECAGYGDED